MKKKIIAAIIIVLALTVVLAGCKSAVKDADGYALLQEYIAESVKSDNYSVTHYKALGGNKSISHILAVEPGEQKEGYSTQQVKYSVKNAATGNETRNDYFYTYSLAEKVKPKKATAADYKYYLFVDAGTTKTKKEIASVQAAFDDPNVAAYTVAEVLKPLSELPAEAMDFNAKRCGVTKEGKTMFLRFKVTDTAHPYAKFSSIEVNVLNGKIVKIGTYGEETTNFLGQTTVAADAEKIDIVYKCPVLNAISYENTDYTLVS